MLQTESWDDLRTPASTIPISGQSGDLDADSDGTLLLDATTEEHVSMLYQMPHAWLNDADCHYRVLGLGSGQEYQT